MIVIAGCTTNNESENSKKDIFPDILYFYELEGEEWIGIGIETENDGVYLFAKYFERELNEDEIIKEYRLSSKEKIDGRIDELDDVLIKLVNEENS